MSSSVLVDTCVWTEVLRKHARHQNEILVKKLKTLIEDHKVTMIGPIRQEILSGIKNIDQFDLLKEQLSFFSDESLLSEDFEIAAQFFNICRASGVQGSNTDFLICAVASRLKVSIFTIDKDFKLFAKHVDIELY